MTSTLRLPLWSTGRRITGLAAANAAAQLAFGTLYIVGARLLGPAEFGRVASVLAISFVLGVSFDFGLSQLLSRDVAAGRLTNADAAALVMRKRVAALILLGAVATVGLAVHWGSTQDVTLPILSGVLAWTLWESITGAAALRAQHRFRAIALTQIMGRTLGMAIGVSLMMVAPAMGLVVGCVFSYLIEAVPAQVLAKFIRRPGSSQALWSAQRESVGYGAASLVSAAQQLATPLIALVAGANVAGIYAAAARFINPLNLLSWAMGSVCVPSLACAQRDPDALRAEERKTLVMAGILAVGPAVAAALGPIVLPILLGPTYGATGQVFAVLAIGVIVSTINQGCMNIVQNWGGQGTVAAVYMFAVCIGLILTLPLAVTGGAGGAAWGSVLTQLMISAGLAWSLLRRERGQEAIYDSISRIDAGSKGVH